MNSETKAWLDHLDCFAKRVITEELGGADYPRTARSIAEALDRIAELEAALRECNEIATTEGNDERNTPEERRGARAVGASIRVILRKLEL